MLGRTAVVLCLTLGLVAPGAAQAATLSRDGSTIVFTDTGADVVNMVAVYKIEGSNAIFIGDSNRRRWMRSTT
jgi:hypothetical protein